MPPTKIDESNSDVLFFTFDDKSESKLIIDLDVLDLDFCTGISENVVLLVGLP